MPPERYLSVVAALGAYTKSLYRSLKCLRHENRLGRQAGCDEVFDEWGSEFAWKRQYRPEAPSA